MALVRVNGATVQGPIQIATITPHPPHPCHRFSRHAECAGRRRPVSITELIHVRPAR